MLVTTKKKPGAMERRYDKLGMAPTPAPAKPAPAQPAVGSAESQADRGPIADRQGKGGTAKGPNKKGQTY